MRILQVVNAYYPPYGSGGVAFVVHNISKALAKRGHKVTVYTTNALDRENSFYPMQNPYNDDGVEVYYFKNIIYKHQIHVYFSKELIEAVRKSIDMYDIVHIHEYRSYISIAVSYYAKKYGIPYVLQVHGSLPRIMAWQKLKLIHDVLFGYRVLRSASRVVALTRAEAEQYKAMGVPEEKIAVIPNGVDLSEYSDLPPRGNFRRKFGIPEEKKIIMYLGRIDRVKGLDILVNAYAYIVNKLKVNNILLVIAGMDFGYLSELKQLLNKLAINSNILLTGPLYGKDKLAAYVDADVFILPSRYEAFGMVILEACACSKPVIASNHKTFSEIIINGETGLLFQTGNVQELVKAIMYVLTHPREAENMGRRARKLIEQKFSLDKVAGSLEALYKEILKEDKVKGERLYINAK